MAIRGTFEFETTAQGDLIDCSANVEALRRLWLHRTMVAGDDLGPGDRGDFDHGAWHMSCHLVAAGGVRRSPGGCLLWLEVSYDATRGEYYPSVTADLGRGTRTVPLNCAEGRSLLRDSTLLGFIEGNSLGRISSRGVQDSPHLFNMWRRQDFDCPVGSDAEGGKVWEHWCTLRDIRPSAPIGSSVLTAYVTLASALGDRFAPTIARGRRDYGHPVQLAAMVHAGFTASDSAEWDTTPLSVPAELEPLLLEAQPACCYQAAKQLTWADEPCYYMFQRRIDGWSSAAPVTASHPARIPER